MSRRDNRRNEAPMSFFSFQDIICCVTGILIMVTLLLVVELAKRPQTLGQGLRTSTPDWVTLAVELKAARKTRDNLTAALERVQATLTRDAQRLIVTPAILEDLRNQVAALRKTCQDRAARQEQSQTEQERLASQVAQAQSARDVLADRVRQLEEEIALERTKIRVTLLGGETSGKKPYLVELAANQVSVAEILSSGEGRLVESIVGADSATRFLHWAGSRSNDSEYFVLLVRPDGAGAFDGVFSNLKNAGFDLGWDVWPTERALFHQPSGE